IDGDAAAGVFGLLNLGAGTTFALGGGILAGQGRLTLGDGTFNFAGGSSSLPTVRLENSALNIGVGSKGPGDFTVAGTGNTLSGDLAAGQSLTVLGDGTVGGATL